MFSGYQDIIVNLKGELLELKETNVTLLANSESKIAIAKMENQIKLLKSKNTDLLDRIKELELFIEKMEEQRQEVKEEYQ